MEGYEERIAKRIKGEANKRGKSAIDLAHDLGVYPTTVERWFRAERLPQKRHRKQLAEQWGLPLDTFELDLEAEEREVHEQLNRIEAKLDLLLSAADLALPEDAETPMIQVEALADADLEGDESEHGADKATGS